MYSSAYVWAKVLLHMEERLGAVTVSAWFDAAEIEINTSTGDVRGSLASGKQFDAKSGTGKVRVPENSEGGSCKIYASTGNIDIKIV